MSASEVLKEIKEKTGLSMYMLNKKIGLKSLSHVSMMISGDRKPDPETTKKIIEFGQKIGMSITWDMIYG